MADEAARFDVRVARFGALGLREHEVELRRVAREEAEALVLRQLETMTPLDRAEFVIQRNGDVA